MKTKFVEFLKRVIVGSAKAIFLTGMGFSLLILVCLSLPWIIVDWAERNDPDYDVNRWRAGL